MTNFSKPIIKAKAKSEAVSLMPCFVKPYMSNPFTCHKHPKAKQAHPRTLNSADHELNSEPPTVAPDTTQHAY